MGSGDQRLKGAVKSEAASHGRAKARIPPRHALAGAGHPPALQPLDRATPEEIRALVHRSSAHIVCFEFGEPVPTRGLARDFVLKLYQNPSRCVEASQTLATSLNKRTVDELLGLPLEEILPRESGYGEVFAQWHTSSLSGQSFEAEIVGADSKRRLFQAALYTRATNESFSRLWMVLREVRPHSTSGARDSVFPRGSANKSDLRRLAGIAHDLNNYLTLLRAQVEAALDQIESTHPGAGPLREAERTLVASSKLARLLLSPQPTSAPSLVPTAVSKLIHEAIELCKPLIPAHITVKIGEIREGLSIQSSPPEIQQALINLVLNARDALDKPGEIAVSVETPYEEQQPIVAIKVRDNGPGIPRQYLDRIFEPYFTTKAHRGGTGLGLSNVKASVESFGGSIKVRSTEGLGTEFTLIFPLEDDHYPTPLPTREFKPEHPLSVLIAEDDNSIRNLLLSMVARLGHRAFGVADGEALVSMIREGLHTYDVILVDDSMPKARGIELLPGLRKLLPHAHIVLMSGDPRLLRDTKAADSRASFLPKPFGTEELAEVLHQAIDHRVAPY